MSMKKKTSKTTKPRWAGVKWRTIHEALQKREPGVYTLRQLLKEHWPREKQPSLYGMVFLGLAAGGCYRRIRPFGKAPNGHQLYEVLGPEAQKEHWILAELKARSQPKGGTGDA